MGMAVARLRVGVIGDPVAHSLSPAMQQPAFDAFAIPAIYERWPTPASELAERVAGLREPDVLGANVTVPHKVAVMALLDEVSPLARRAGAVNTIVNRDGRLAGDNTDIHGFATSVGEVCRNPRSRSTLVLGAGGAARAVALALEAMGVERIVIANRDPARAERLVADLAPTLLHPIAATEAALKPELRRTSLLINATSLGWRAGESPLAEEQIALLPRNALVVDLTYRDTDLLLAARARGLRTLDGLSMLVHQGARAFELWTGNAAPVELMRSAALVARDAPPAGEA